MALTTIMGTMRRTYFVEHSYISRKFYATKADDKRPGTQSTLSRQNIKQNVEGYFLTKFIDYVKNYEMVLEKKFPAAMNVYRTFVIGMKDLYSDLKQYVKVYKIANTSTLHLRALTRKELELYYQIPKDMKKVAPVFLLSALPLANYVIFPLAYMYPRKFLSTQFWSIQQRSQFQTEFLRERLQYNMRVFRFMQTKLDESKNDTQYKELKKVLGMLGSGLHPSVVQLLEIHEIFSRPPFSLESLPGHHLKNLCGLHGIHNGWRKRLRLAEHAFVIHHMDLAIRREGGVHNLSQDALIYACYLRGLNPTNLSTDMMVDWLKQWVDVSLMIDGNNVSLFLHLPILIAYNYPNNWILLYNKS